MKNINPIVERIISFTQSAIAFSVLFVFCGLVWLFDRHTGCDYKGDGTFKCRRCGWHGRSGGMASISVGVVCPVCARRKRETK